MDFLFYSAVALHLNQICGNRFAHLVPTSSLILCFFFFWFWFLHVHSHTVSTQASPPVRKKTEKFQLNYFFGAINTGRSAHLHFRARRGQSWQQVDQSVQLQSHFICRILYFISGTSTLDPTKCQSVQSARRKFTSVRLTVFFFFLTCWDMIVLCKRSFPG